MARPNTLSLIFIGISTNASAPKKLLSVGISTNATKLGALQFWGISAVPTPDSIIFYQVN
jgi:hypothetical protein